MYLGKSVIAKKAGDDMTIKKRLFWSNILMIVLPAAFTVLIGAVCMGVIWLLLHGRAGFDRENDFEHVYKVISKMLENGIEKEDDFFAVKSLLDESRMALIIMSEGETYFKYGEEEYSDEELPEAAVPPWNLEGQLLATRNDRTLYVGIEKIGRRDYTIYLFGNAYDKESYSGLEDAWEFAGIVIALGILLSILFTNRFLTKFVFRRIEEPLDILAGGVHEIRDGNLEYRIAYNRKDEFLPVCEDFNEMAVRLKQSVDMMQHQEKSRKELIAGISHDLRSPLTSIQAYVEGLLDGVAKTPEAQMRYLETVKQKSENLAHIISQLFLFSKMELGEYPENPCRLMLDEKISETVFALREEYRRQGLEIHMELVPVEVHADPVYLHRIFMNILENSLKYKMDGQGNLWISLERTADGCRMSFADDGPGVPKEALPHLFEVFYRSDPSRQNPDKGSGLGLAIVANAVQRMGGSIEAFDNKPQGLIIRITLPKNKCEFVEGA